jgi:class 3 adenylate cyclase
MNIIGTKCVIFAAVFLFARELEKEYTKSENVLANILPRSIVKRIKQGELPIVDHVPDVTILFADLVGFTKASTELHPNFLIGLFLRDIFQEFDELVYKHGLEKIKTIGDAYMVVGGLNHGERLSLHSYSQSAEYQNQKAQATNIMFFAVDMFKALRDVNRKHGLSFDLRVGIHTGPVVAGVLGLKRFAYDVWGDTVNVRLLSPVCIMFLLHSACLSRYTFVTI